MKKLTYRDSEGSAPVKPGDPVFVIVWEGDVQAVNRHPVVVERAYKAEWLLDIGKTVFLTREEADAAAENFRQTWRL